jgi:hypothetical protein
MGRLIRGCILFHNCLVYCCEETIIKMKGVKTMLKRNEGTLDRIVRVALGAVLLPTGLILLGVLKGSILGFVFAGLGLWVLITGLTGVCPLYISFGINTLEKEKELIAKCKSMMASFRQEPAAIGNPETGQTCELCPPSIGESHPQEG